MIIIALKIKSQRNCQIESKRTTLQCQTEINRAVKQRAIYKKRKQIVTLDSLMNNYCVTNIYCNAVIR